MPDTARRGSDAIDARLLWMLAGALLACHATIAWLRRDPLLSPDANDYGLNLLLSRSLQQLRYIDPHIIGTPVEAQYPPGYPLILATAGLLFGGGFPVAQAATALCSVLALLLAFDIARRLVGGVPALGLLAALAVNPHMLMYATLLRSEQPYLLASLAALWAAVALPEGAGRLWAIGGAAIYAALTRSIGISLVVAVLVVWLLERRYRAVVWFALASALLVGGWLLWTYVAPDRFPERSYASVATAVLHQQQPVYELLLSRLARATIIYATKAPLVGLAVPTIPGTIVDNVLWVLVISALALVGGFTLWRQARLIPAYLVAYLAVLFLYPIHMTRFFVPLVPLVLLLMLLGLSVLLRRRLRLLPWLSGGLCLSMVVNAGSMAAGAIRDRCGPGPGAERCFSPVAQAFLASAYFIRDSLPPDAAVVTVKESVLYYYSGHQVIHPQLPAMAAPGQVLTYLTERGVNYILLSDYPGGSTLSRLIGADCRRLDLLFSAQPNTYLLRVRPAGMVITRSDGCAAVESAAATLSRRAAD